MGCTSSLRAEEKHQLPILALLFTVGLSTTLTSLNRNQPAQDQPIMHALFTVEVAIMYALYMLISRILALALSCIEPSQPKKEEEEHLVWDDLEEEGPPARGVIPGRRSSPACTWAALAASWPCLPSASGTSL